MCANCDFEIQRIDNLKKTGLSDAQARAIIELTKMSHKDITLMRIYYDLKYEGFNGDQARDVLKILENYNLQVRN